MGVTKACISTKNCIEFFHLLIVRQCPTQACSVGNIFTDIGFYSLF
jgi:hypothetical protein